MEKLTLTNLEDKGFKIIKTDQPCVIFTIDRDMIFLPKLDLPICNFSIDKSRDVSNYTSIYIALANMIRTVDDFQIALP